MGNKIFDRNFTTNIQSKLNAKFIDSGFFSDNNGNSMFGTFWTQSTSAIAGITESVITPGFRFIKFVIGIMQVYKKLNSNLTTIKNKINRIEDILNGFNTGKHNHIRKSVIKRKVNKK